MNWKVLLISACVLPHLGACVTDDELVGDEDPVCEGKCDGTLRSFPLPATLDLGPDASSIAVGDIDRDGFLDLAALVSNPTQNKVEVVVAFGDAAGKWQRRFRRAINGSRAVGTRDSSSSVVAIEDVDRDGRLDVVTASGIARGRANRAFTWIAFAEQGINALQPVGVLRRGSETMIVRGSQRGHVERCTTTGACTALPGQPPACGDDVLCAVEDLAIADFTGDGILDVIAGRPQDTIGVDELRLWDLGTGFRMPHVLQADGLNAVDLEIGDVNRDGITDLVAQQRVAITDFPTYTHVLLATPGGPQPLTRVQTLYNHDNHSDNAALADVDGDGCVDLLMIGVDTSHVALRRGERAGARCTGFLGPHVQSQPQDAGWTTIPAFSGMIGIQQLDINGDSKPEWAIRSMVTPGQFVIRFAPVRTQ